MVGDDEEGTNTNNKLLVEALKAELAKIMKEGFEEFRKERTHSSREQEPAVPRASNGLNETRIYYSSSQSTQRRTRRVRKETNAPRDKMAGFKVRIPPFHGTNDPDAYLDWEKKIEIVFDCCKYTEANKVNVAVTEFYDYALSWWDQITTTKRRLGDFPIDTWAQLKLLMRRRFVPSHYHQELHFKLRNLTQGSRQDIVDNGRGKNTFDRDKLVGRCYGRDEHRRKNQGEQLQSKKQKNDDDNKWFVQEVPKTMKAIQKEKQVTHQAAGPKANNESKAHKESIASNTNRDDKASESLAVHIPREEPSTKCYLLKRGMCLNQVQESVSCESLFHTRCSVQDKICSLIVDSGIGANIASSTMVEKLSLETMKHPKPYKLQWLANNGEIEVTRQVVVSFSIGKYVDEVVCDVLPVEASHMVLGRPWSSDRQAIFESQKNRYTFQFGKRKIALAQLSLLEAYPNEQAKSNALEQLVFLKTSLEAKCFIPSIQTDFELKKLTPLEPEKPSSMDSFSGKIQRSLPLDNELEQGSNLEPEPVLMPLPFHYPRKHCKEIDLVGNEPSLFVIVSAQDEKRFGLESVKEFRVSSTIFDKMVPSFEELTHERLSKQMGFLVNKFREFNPSLRVSLCSNVFGMFRTETECSLFKTGRELDCVFMNALIEPYKLRYHVLEHKHSKMTLGAFDNDNILDHFRRLFVYSTRTFDVISLVFVKERQDHDSREKTIQYLSNQVDYGPLQQLSCHFMFWNWKYLRKETLNRGSRTVFKRTRREDDQRFKPPDLAQTKHLNLCFLCLIKEEPPDAATDPKTRLHIFGGNFLVLVHFLITNLLYFHVDHSDLRSNPFQEGGDDVIMDQQLEPEQGWEKELEPEQAQQAMEMTSGPITRAKAKQLKQAVSTLLRQAESNLSPMANPTTLVLILAD